MGIIGNITGKFRKAQRENQFYTQKAYQLAQQDTQMSEHFVQHLRQAQQIDTALDQKIDAEEKEYSFGLGKELALLNAIQLLVAKKHSYLKIISAKRKAGNALAAATRNVSLQIRSGGQRLANLSKSVAYQAGQAVEKATTSSIVSSDAPRKTQALQLWRQQQEKELALLANEVQRMIAERRAELAEFVPTLQANAQIAQKLTDYNALLKEEDAKLEAARMDLIAEINAEIAELRKERGDIVQEVNELRDTRGVGPLPGR